MPMVFKKCPSCSSNLPVACKTCHCGHVFLAKRLPGKPADRKVEVLPGRLRPERPRREIRRQDYVFKNATKFNQHQTIYPTPHYPLLLPKPPSSQPATNLMPANQSMVSMTSTSDSASATMPLPMQTPSELTGNSSSNPTSKVLEPGSKDDGNAIGQKSETKKETTDVKPPNSRRRGRPKGSKDKKPRGSKAVCQDNLIFRPNSSRSPNAMALRIDRKRHNLPSDESHNLNDGSLGEFDLEKYEFEKQFCISDKREIFALILKDINSKIARQRFIIS